MCSEATTPRVGGHDKRAAAPAAVTTTITVTRTTNLEALDEQRVHGRVQLLSRLRSEVNNDLLENRFHFRPLHKKNAVQNKGQENCSNHYKKKKQRQIRQVLASNNTNLYPRLYKIERKCRLGIIWGKYGELPQRLHVEKHYIYYRRFMHRVLCAPLLAVTRQPGQRQRRRPL